MYDKDQIIFQNIGYQIRLIGFWDRGIFLRFPDSGFLSFFSPSSSSSVYCGCGNQKLFSGTVFGDPPLCYILSSWSGKYLTECGSAPGKAVFLLCFAFLILASNWVRNIVPLPRIEPSQELDVVDSSHSLFGFFGNTFQQDRSLRHQF